MRPGHGSSCSKQATQSTLAVSSPAPPATHPLEPCLHPTQLPSRHQRAAAPPPLARPPAPSGGGPCCTMFRSLPFSHHHHLHVRGATVVASTVIHVRAAATRRRRRAHRVHLGGTPPSSAFHWQGKLIAWPLLVAPCHSCAATPQQQSTPPPRHHHTPPSLPRCLLPLCATAPAAPVPLPAHSKQVGKPPPLPLIQNRWGGRGHQAPRVPFRVCLPPPCPALPRSLLLRCCSAIARACPPPPPPPPPP